MSNHDSFSDIDSPKIPDRPEPMDDDVEYGICPSCRFKLAVHSAKQIVCCALKEIRLVLGVEKK